MAAPQNCKATPHTYTRSQTWLDELPLDVCMRIASFLPTTQQLNQANMTCTDHDQYIQQIHHISPHIALASVSDYQRQVFQTAKSKVLNIERDSHTQSSFHYQYTNLIAKPHESRKLDIREIRIAPDSPFKEHIPQILALSTIKKAAIPYIPALVHSLILGRSVTALELEATDHHSVPYTDFNLLPDLLKACPVENLVLNCHWCSDFNEDLVESCFALKLLDGLKQDPTGSSVRTLRVVCSSRWLGPKTTAVTYFPNLEEFILEHNCIFGDDFFFDTDCFLEVEPAFEERLTSLKSVGMIHCGEVTDLTAMLGTKMTIFSSHVVLTAETLFQLSVCENLKSLDLVLSEGAERCFPNQLRFLRCVSLTWKRRVFSSPHAEYYSPNQDFFIKLVRQNKELQELQLHNVRISYFSLKETLSYMGSRLRTLRLPIFHQGDCPLIRFKDTISLIIRHNRDLSKLEFLPSSCNTQEFQQVIYRHEGRCRSNSHTFCNEHLRPIDRVLQVLSLRVPGLSFESLIKVPWAFLPCR